MESHRNSTSTWALRGALVALLSCGGSPPSANASPTTTDEGNLSAGASGWAQAQTDISARRATAQAEIGEASRALQLAADDCGDRCTALGTLRTAVDHLCSIRENHDDDGRCKEARVTLTTADVTVKAACDGCRPPKPDDPSTDL